MQPFRRTLPRSLPQLRRNAVLVRAYATGDRTSDRVPTNDPSPPDLAPNVSSTNALPTDAQGARDKPLQEVPEEGESQRQMQAPNRNEVWSRSQQPRDRAMSGPRFEQTIMGLQVDIPLRVTA